MKNYVANIKVNDLCGQKIKSIILHVCMWISFNYNGLNIFTVSWDICNSIATYHKLMIYKNAQIMYLIHIDPPVVTASTNGNCTNQNTQAQLTVCCCIIYCEVNILIANS